MSFMQMNLELKSLVHNLQKYIEQKLWLEVIVGLILGIATGLIISPGVGLLEPRISKALANWLALPGTLFMKLVQMIMIPLIGASIIKGIAVINVTGDLTACVIFDKIYGKREMFNTSQQTAGVMAS